MHGHRSEKDLARNTDFHFLLLPDFSMLSLATALETLKNANIVATAPTFSWTTYSETGLPVVSSLGTEFPVDAAILGARPEGIVIVISGEGVQNQCSPPILNWLRTQARFGAVIGGLCTGAYVLAKAGLLDGKSATIHWQYQQSFSENFEAVSLCDRNFVIDGKRCSSAGGVSAIDLVLELVTSATNEEIGMTIAEQMNYGSIRDLQKMTGVGVPHRRSIRNTKVAAAITLMQDNLEEPMNPSSVAREIGVSVRQLERLFRSSLQQSPKAYYMALRLDRAKDLLLHSQLDVTQVSVACGFQSASHFSKCFRSKFARSAHSLRNSPR